MNRRAFLAASAGGAACSRDPRPRLNVFNWSDYIAPQVIPNFEREFGVRVRYGVYEVTEEMVARVWSGNSGWDVVFPSNSYVEPLRQAGLLQRLDHARLPGLANLERAFQAPLWDRGLDWSMPYMWGATGIVYQRTLDPAPRAWRDLWSAPLKGRMTMLDDPAEVLGACLKKLGYSVNATSPAELAAAKQEAVTQKAVLRAYLNAEVRDQLIAGDLLAAQVWRLTAQQAIDGAPERLEFVFPEEGFPIYADCACILRESKRSELAHEFLNYLLRPEVAAATAVAMKTSTCNGAARPLLPPAVRDSPIYYPPADVLARGEWFTPVPAAAQRLRDRLWTEIKSA
ncbi:MAG: spermidine/putrescine ABC transporter substrate-binding protein [Acidobacteria bacterium]|nr:spermidine/putrescine ABC transporter substrate-binding protein [Acidobacteriota bacterium]